MKKEIKRLIKELEAQGAEVDRGKTHLRVTRGDQLIGVIPSSPGGGDRIMKNVVSQLRRRGFKVTWNGRTR